MSAVRKIFEEYQKKTIPTSNLFELIRPFHHSLHASDRTQAIELLGSIPDPDAARELIQIYHDCQWRFTRFQIIKALSRYPTQRSLEFLFRLALQPDDIPLCEAAIWALGQTHHNLAGRFLVQLSKSCSELIKPFVVGALGQLPDRTLAGEFLEELPVAIATNQTLLVKNLVLTVGELKIKEALPLLERLVHQKTNRPLALSALLSMGKIAREVKILDRCESQFRDDLFEYQIFSNVKNQIQFRSQWRLEDYLQKLFESPVFHPTLPFELNGFNPDDVKEGLKLFSAPQHFNRLCLALSRIDFPNTVTWYNELFDLEKMSAEQLVQVLESLSSHMNAEVGPLLRSLKPIALKNSKSPLFDKWLEAHSMCLPAAEVEFKAFMESPEYRALPDEQRIRTINHFVNFGLTVQSESKRSLTISKILENLLDSEGSRAVQARIVRAIGQMGVPGNKIYGFARDHVQENLLIASCLYFLEMCPDKSAASILMKLLTECKPKSLSDAALLKALAAQSELPASKELDDYLVKNLSGTAQLETRRQALHLLAKHPRKSLLPHALPCLKGEDRLQLAAVIALKSFADENTADVLAHCLNSTSESIRGRALDTLIALPGNRAKRLVVDFLSANPEDVDVCDKIARCLNPPDGPGSYFTEAVQKIIDKFPAHPNLEDLLTLKERLGSGASVGGTTALPKGTDITAIDLELTKRIPQYQFYDEAVKSALRSAEVPFHKPEIFDEYVDKSASVLGYCKAIDMILEKQLGQKLLFPKLENALHEFQNAIHAASLNEDYPSAERVLLHLGLEKHFSPQSLPVHKMGLVSRGILTGKIVSEHFKILDGLRAWAVILLLFARRPAFPETSRPLLGLKDATEPQIVDLAKKLMALQDLRNPAAHRQTVVRFPAVDQVRNEVVLVLNRIAKMFAQ